MKLNFKKVGSYYSAWINDANVKYGWYESGRAFIAKNDEVMTYKQAYKEFVPKHSYNLYDAFFDGVTRYPKTINGIVRFLIDKYNK